MELTWNLTLNSSRDIFTVAALLSANQLCGKRWCNSLAPPYLPRDGKNQSLRRTDSIITWVSALPTSNRSKRMRRRKTSGFRNKIPVSYSMDGFNPERALCESMGYRRWRTGVLFKSSILRLVRRNHREDDHPVLLDQNPHTATEPYTTNIDPCHPEGLTIIPRRERSSVPGRGQISRCLKSAPVRLKMLKFKHSTWTSNSCLFGTSSGSRTSPSTLRRLKRPLSQTTSSHYNTHYNQAIGVPISPR